MQAAKAMDVLGNKEARVYVSAVKAMVPEKVCQIIDDAIQMHGATGLSNWTPLAKMYSAQRTLRVSQVVTLLVGAAALLLASRATRVLDVILLTYSFMVSGLLAPTLGALFWRRASAAGAGAAIVTGGGLTLLLESELLALPSSLASIGLAPTAYGLALSAAVFVAVSLWRPDATPRSLEDS